MADHTDVAGALFTSTYRNVKLAGKAPPPVNLEGTGTVSGMPALSGPESGPARRGSMRRKWESGYIILFVRAALPVR